MSTDAKSDRLAAALESGDLERRLDAIAEVTLADLTRDPQAHCSERALAALIECLADSRKVVQRRAADALGSAAAHDPRIVPGLRAALDSGDPRRRWGAAYALGLIDRALDLRARNALLEALANPDGDVRWAAKDLLVRLAGDNPDEVRRSLIALEHSPDHDARKMALYCLRDLEFAGPEVRAMAARASRAAESGVRLAALSLLVGLAEASGAAHDDAQDDTQNVAIDIALRCLESDPDPGVRRAAASALGHFGAAPRAAQALERAASQTADPALAKTARHTLAGIAATKS